MTSPRFIGVREVADMMGYPDNDHFLRRRKRLEHDFAFPRPCPWEKKVLRYKASEIEDWIDHGGSAMQALTDGKTSPDQQESVVMLAAAKVA